MKCPEKLNVSALADWYLKYHRDLPWRRLNSDAYSIWVSEIMLQQTQVSTVIPYFKRWLERFPDVKTLAEAQQEEVLLYWAGLGYYARARNMHSAAIEIMQRHAGLIPRAFSDLLSLPGIGRYTAGAILSTAYDLPYPSLDVNVNRVLCRVYALIGDPAKPDNRNTLEDIMFGTFKDSKYPPSIINQGLMELGALICKAHDPACERCPLLPHCRAGNTPDPTDWPQLPAGIRQVQETHCCLMLLHGLYTTKYLMLLRPPHGLWGGLWEFPRAVCFRGETPEECAVRAAEDLGLKVTLGARLGMIKHQVTHHAITLYAYQAELYDETHPLADHAFYADSRWVVRSEMEYLPLAAPQREIATRLLI